jgi:hypothetical protein
VSLNLNYLFHNHLECGGYPWRPHNL